MQVCAHTHIHMISFIHYSRQNVCVPSKFILCWNSNLQWDGSWRWGLWGWIGHKDRDFMSGTRSLIKEAPNSSLAPSTVWGHGKKTPSMNQEPGPLQTLNLPAPWPWTSQTVSHPAWYSAMAAQIETPTFALENSDHFKFNQLLLSPISHPQKASRYSTYKRGKSCIYDYDFSLTNLFKPFNTLFIDCWSNWFLCLVLQ